MSLKLHALLIFCRPLILYFVVHLSLLNRGETFLGRCGSLVLPSRVLSSEERPPTQSLPALLHNPTAWLTQPFWVHLSPYLA